MLLTLTFLALTATAPVDSPHLIEQASPAAAQSGEPRFTLGADGALYLSWIERGADGLATLRFSRRTKEGWAPARTIASGKNWFVNWADFPSVAVLADGTLAAHWLQKSGRGTYAYDVRVAISTDHGDSWGPSFRLHRDDRPAEHGFVSLFPVDEARFGAFWLDGQAMVDDKGESIPDSNMSLRYTTFDATGKRGPELVVDDRVCECCQTDGLLLESGNSLVVYRDRSPDEVRDIGCAMVTGSAADGRSVKRLAPVHGDGWLIAGCPVNGPVLRRHGTHLAVAYFTAGNDGTARVMLARRSNDDGPPRFESPTRIDDGGAIGRVDLVVDADGTCWVSWLAHGDDGAEIRLRRHRPGVADSGVADSGVAGSGQWTLTTTREARSSGFPRLVRFEGALQLAWTDAATRQVRVGTVVIPQ